MQIILALSIIVSVYLAGCASALLFNRRNGIEIASLGFILGTLLFTLLLLAAHQYGQLLITARLVLTVAYSLGFVALGILGWQRHHVVQPLKTSLKTFQRSTLWVKLGVGFLTILFLSSLLQNYFWPVTDWDALALYDFRARVVAETGSFADGIQLGYFFQYPPFTSLLHTSLYVVGFERAKIWYSLLYISLIGVFYALLRKHTSQSLSLLGAVVLAVNPLILEHATMAYTNLSHTLFLSLGVLYILDWFRHRAVSTLLLGSVLVMGSTWVRMSEPFWIIPLLLLVFIIIFSLIKKYSVLHSVASGVGIVWIYMGRQIWPGFVAQLHPPQPAAPANPDLALRIPVIGMFVPYMRALSSLQPSFILQRLWEVWSYSTVYIFPVFSIYLMPALVLAFFDLPRKQLYTWMLWATLSAYLLLLLVGTFVFSLFDNSWSAIGGSANRMSMFLIPLTIFAVSSSHSLQVWTHKNQK